MIQSILQTYSLAPQRFEYKYDISFTGPEDVPDIGSLHLRALPCVHVRADPAWPVASKSLVPPDISGNSNKEELFE